MDTKQSTSKSPSLHMSRPSRVSITSAPYTLTDVLSELALPSLQQACGAAAKDGSLCGLRVSCKTGLEIVSSAATTATVRLRNNREVNVTLAKCVKELHQLKQLIIAPATVGEYLMGFLSDSTTIKQAEAERDTALCDFLDALDGAFPSITHLVLGRWALTEKAFCRLPAKFPCMTKFTACSCIIPREVTNQHQLLSYICSLPSLYSFACDCMQLRLSRRLDVISVASFANITDLSIDGHYREGHLHKLSALVNLQRLHLWCYCGAPHEHFPAFIQSLTCLQYLGVTFLAKADWDALATLTALTHLAFWRVAYHEPLAALPSIRQISCQHAPTIANVMPSCPNAHVLNVGRDGWHWYLGYPDSSSDEDELRYFQCLNSVDDWLMHDINSSGSPRSSSTKEVVFSGMEARHVLRWGTFALLGRIWPFRYWESIRLQDSAGINKSMIDFIATMFPNVTRMRISGVKFPAADGRQPVSLMPLLDMPLNYLEISMSSCEGLQEEHVAELREAFEARSHRKPSFLLKLQ